MIVFPFCISNDELEAHFNPQKVLACDASNLNLVFATYLYQM